MRPRADACQSLRTSNVSPVTNGDSVGPRMREVLQRCQSASPSTPHTQLLPAACQLQPICPPPTTVPTVDRPKPTVVDAVLVVAPMFTSSEVLAHLPPALP